MIFQPLLTSKEGVFIDYNGLEYIVVLRNKMANMSWRFQVESSRLVPLSGVSWSRVSSPRPRHSRRCKGQERQFSNMRLEEGFRVFSDEKEEEGIWELGLEVKEEKSWMEFHFGEVLKGVRRRASYYGGDSSGEDSNDSSRIPATREDDSEDAQRKGRGPSIREQLEKIRREAKVSLPLVYCPISHKIVGVEHATFSRIWSDYIAAMCPTDLKD
uniref:Uncharacterized protein n=1 Tax=Cannabis sativa TaxID=3483 RepID=A0A803QDD6_CANSA